MSKEAQVFFLGKATGPTPEMLAAQPYITAGFVLMVVAFVCYLGFTIVAFRRHAPGRWFSLSGLVVVLSYFLFHNTLAHDAELEFGPTADAFELIAYGISGLLVTVGYARLVLHIRKENNAR